MFCTVKSAIPFFLFSETVQLFQNDDQKEVSLRLMRCLRTAKWRLGKGSILGWELLLRFIFLIFKNFLCFAVCFFNGKKKKKIVKKPQKDEQLNSQLKMGFNLLIYRTTSIVTHNTKKFPPVFTVFTDFCKFLGQKFEISLKSTC